VSPSLAERQERDSNKGYFQKAMSKKSTSKILILFGICFTWQTISHNVHPQVTTPITKSESRSAVGQTDIAKFITTQEARILDDSESYTEIPCKSKYTPPKLHYNMLLRGYMFSWVDSKDIFLGGKSLSYAIRITSQSNKDQGFFYAKMLPIDLYRSAIERRGYTSLGRFGMPIIVGEGEFKLDWMIRDDQGRICSGHQKVRARLPEKDTPVRLSHGYVGTPKHGLYSSQMPLDHSSTGSIHLKLMINIPPFLRTDVSLKPSVFNNIFWILGAFSLDERVKEMSITAFNIREQKVLYRRDKSRVLYLGDFSETLKTYREELDGRFVTPEAYSDEKRIKFLLELLSDELCNQNQPDAVVFIGPTGFKHEGELKEGIKDLPFKNLTQLFYLRTVYGFGSVEGDVFTWLVDKADGKSYYLNSPNQMWRSIDNILDQLEKQASKDN